MNAEAINRDVRFQPKQWDLVKLILGAVAVIIGYGGAKGGGKSGGLRRIALYAATKFSGVRVGIVRRVLKDLRLDHIDEFFREWPDLRAHYHATSNEIRLPNGSTIVFLYAETYAEVQRQFNGPQYFLLLVDQAEQFEQRELEQMATANRWPGYPPGSCKIVFFFNPGGKGTEYLRRIFWLKDYKANERPQDFAFIHAFGWDNYEWFRGVRGALPEREFYRLSSEQRFDLFISQTDYGQKLNAMPESIRAGYLLGSFESFAGQYFAGVWDEKTCVLARREVDAIVQPWWTRWMAQDWGFGDHDSHGWYAVGQLAPSEWERHFGGECEVPMQVCVKYREYVIAGRAEQDLAMDIAARTPAEERRYMQRFFLSQDAFGQRAKQAGDHTVGLELAATMRRNGLPAPEPAIQDRVNGWRFMFQCLRQANMRGGVVTRERAAEGPAFFVSAECPETISSIPLAVRDEKNHEDVMRVAGALWEDVTDETRYGLYSMLSSRVAAPIEVRRAEVYNAYQDPHARAMAMLQFENKERDKRRISRRGSFR